MSVALHKSFIKLLKKLPMKTRKAFVSRKNLLLQDPSHPLLKTNTLRGAFKGFHSINITGGIRAIVKIEGEDYIFTDIGSHGELYK